MNVERDLRLENRKTEIVINFSHFPCLMVFASVKEFMKNKSEPFTVNEIK